MSSAHLLRSFPHSAIISLFVKQTALYARMSIQHADDDAIATQNVGVVCDTH